MYRKFYGFKEKPFHLVPNPKFLFLSKKHQNALTYLEYGLSEGSGFILLTGDIGAGKTTVIRYILNKIEGNIGVEVGVISNTNVDSGELINLVLQEFGLESIFENKAKSLEIVFRYLIKNYSLGKRVLLIIDEAQNLSNKALEEVRMLSNLQTDDQTLLQIILVGQPDLKRRLNTAALAQLSQRISVFYHLGALEREEVKKYIIFRLETAEGPWNLFEEDTFDLIYQASGGIPRIINILCDTALVYGYAESLQRIGSDVVAKVIQDKEGLGLMASEQVAPAPPVEENVNVQHKDEYSQRLLALEERVAGLQQLDWRLTEIERQGTQANERMIAELTGLLRDEREKTDKLLLEYGRLKAKVGMYVNAGSTSGNSPIAPKSPAEGHPSSSLSEVMERSKDPNQQSNSKERMDYWFQRILHTMT